MSTGSQAAPADDAADRAVRSLAPGFSAAGWQPRAGQPGAPWRFVARTSQFRWSWMATRLHAFAFAMPLRGDEDVAWLDAQLATAVQYARDHKGGLPEGFQSGSGSILIGVGSGLSPAVRAWTERVHGRAFAAVTHPVLVDVSTGEVLDPGRPVLGVVYHSYLHGVVTDVVTPAVRRPPAGA